MHIFCIRSSFLLYACVRSFVVFSFFMDSFLVQVYIPVLLPGRLLRNRASIVYLFKVRIGVLHFGTCGISRLVRALCGKPRPFHRSDNIEL
jgi:hypothetical protein